MPIILLIGISSCKISPVLTKEESSHTPSQYGDFQSKTSEVARMNWRDFFGDDNLTALVDSALNNNQELNITFQEILLEQNEVMAKKGEYLPFVGIRGGALLEKEGRYTRHGAVDEQLDIKHGTPFPEPLQDYKLALEASWELDIWHKLRHSKKAAVSRYLASIEGKNFIITNLIAEVASSYYELLALDNILAIVQQNIGIQNEVLRIIRHQKEAAMVSQLAVTRFEAQVLNTKNLQYDIQQQIVETENRINVLMGRFPQPIARQPLAFNDITVDDIATGVPSQLLENRPDIRQAELELAAAKLDVKSARANFYPSFSIESGIGFQAFKPSFLLRPESLLYHIGGGLVAPLINRSAIKAAYYNANAKQLQAIYHYEWTILNAYAEVLNHLSKIKITSESYATKQEEAELLTRSIQISSSLFNSARADYMEVLLTQREALESKMELVEMKLQQLQAKVGIYRSLGGGWN